MTIENIFYIFYSFIQGITEFIPISSSGHLNFLELIYDSSNNRNFLYETSAHFASLLALLLYLYKYKHFNFENFKTIFLPIILGTFPAIIVGFFIITHNVNLISMKLIGFMSIIGGVILYISDSKMIKKLHINNKNIKFLIAGFFQCLAFLPGFSRSGSCIIAFRILGDKRRTSSVNSLYLGVPIIVLSFLSNFKDYETMIFDFNLVIIFIITFLVAYITLILFIKFIESISFTPFVVYRIFFGAVILIYFN